MMKVFRKGGLPIKTELGSGIYQLTISFERQISSDAKDLSIAHEEVEL
jgi:hypothetical protein